MVSEMVVKRVARLVDGSVLLMVEEMVVKMVAYLVESTADLMAVRKV